MSNTLLGYPIVLSNSVSGPPKIVFGDFATAWRTKQANAAIDAEAVNRAYGGF